MACVPWEIPATLPGLRSAALSSQWATFMRMPSPSVRGYPEPWSASGRTDMGPDLLGDVLQPSAAAEHLRDAGSLHPRHILVLDEPAQEHQHIVEAHLL